MADLTYDGYVRVSRVAGRSGDSYRSPSDQREIIEQLARAKAVRLDEVVVEEDVSGKAPIDQRQLGRLIRKVEDGRSGGIICWRITRWARDFAEGVTAAERVRKAGGRIITEDLDTATPMHRGLLALLLDIAEQEMDNKKATWKRATDGAIERGLHIGRVPLGYVRPIVGRNEATGKPIHGPLVLDPDHPEHVEAVRHVFRERAVGATWGRLRADIEERWGLKLSRSSVYQITACRTYLGEVRHGDAVKANAHPAIVSEIEYQAAQDAAGKAPVRNGLIRNTGILHGLVYCSGCGGRCYTGTTGRPGSSVYGCANKRTVRCPAPATVTVARLDDYVLAEMLPRIDTTWDAEEHVRQEVEAVQRLTAAQRELEAFLSVASAADLGEHYRTEVAKRREAIQVAQADVYDLMALANQAGVIELNGSVVPIDPRKPEIWAALPIDKKRAIAGTVVDRVVIKKAGRGSRRPVAERVTIEWKAPTTVVAPGVAA